MRNEKIITLKLTGAVAIDGNVVRAGTLVEMIESEAKDLLRRGKAVLATERNTTADEALDGTENAPDADSKGDEAQAAKPARAGRGR